MVIRQAPLYLLKVHLQNKPLVAHDTSSKNLGRIGNQRHFYLGNFEVGMWQHPKVVCLYPIQNNEL